MNLEIINQQLRVCIYGFSGVAINKYYAGTEALSFLGHS